MSLSRRLTLVAAGVAALCVGVACVAAYLTARSQLLGEVDRGLRQQGDAVVRLVGARAAPFDPAGASGARLPLPQTGPREGGPLPYLQLVRRDGSPIEIPGAPRVNRLPVDAADRALASGGGAGRGRDVEVDGVRLRLRTVALPRRLGALQLARPLDGTLSTLRRLGAALAGIGFVAVALAALLARTLTRRLTAPLREVADAARHVGETDDLARRIAVRSDDEVGALASRFNVMLDRLEGSRAELAGSVEAQRQLVADASHELRTPITSLRTNIEVLVGDEGRLEPAARRALLDDLVGQTEELGALVADVIELARGDAAAEVREAVRLDEVATEAAARIARHFPQVAVQVDATPTVVEGDADRLARAVANLVDNAAKHAPAGSVVDVVVGPDGVEVRDAGPGVPPADRERVFDRFHRGEGERARSGTGLGLAIVRQVAEAHGGSARVDEAPGGGARFVLALPGAVAVRPGEVPR